MVGPRVERVRPAQGNSPEWEEERVISYRRAYTGNNLWSTTPNLSAKKVPI